MIQVQVAERYRTAAVRPTPRVCEVAAMFGLGVDESHAIEVVPPTTLTLEPAQVVFVTGASGGGKTTLLRLIGEQLAERDDTGVIDFNDLNDAGASASAADAQEAALVDHLATFGGTLEDAVRWLALAGLNDAAVMLRRPRELSDGQRYRLRLAEATARAEAAAAAGRQAARLIVTLADEFGATLDRLTAKVVARNVRKWTRRSGACFIAATTHDDLLEPIEPDVLIVQQPGSGMRVITREQCDAR